MVNLLFLIFFLAIVSSIVWTSWRYGISPTPTSQKVKNSLLKVLPPLPSDSVIYELGSGWGNLAFTIADHYPKSILIGYEISPIPYLASKMIRGVKSCTNVYLKRKDFFSVSLKDASLVVCYLYPGAMEKLKIKFSQELKPGTYIITHTFAIPGWKPLSSILADDLYKTPIYLYCMN